MVTLANQYFAFFSIDLAEAITLSGQLSIQWKAEKTINKYLNQILKTENKDYVIAIDTDSVYITMDEMVKQIFPEDTPKEKIIDFLTKAESQLEEVIADGYEDLASTPMHSKTKWKWDVRLLQTEVYGLQRNGTY